MGTRFQQVNLAVRDMESAIAFYRLLGLDIPDSYEWPAGSGAHHVEAATDDDYRFVLDNHEMIAIWHPGFVPARPDSSPVIGLQVDSRAEVDELCRKVRQGGHTVAVEPYDAFWGSRYAVVVDPDGHHVGIRSPRDESARYVPNPEGS